MAACSEGSQQSCRICLDATDEPLISPCSGCRGSSSFVHFSCIAECYKTNKTWWDLRCPTCKRSYEGRAACELGNIGVAQSKKEYGAKSLEVAYTLLSLSNVHANLGGARDMKDLLERALAILEVKLGREHSEVSGVLASLGNAYGELGDVKRKKEFLERALVIHEACQEPDNRRLACHLGNLANAYGDLGDMKRMRELLERALAIFKKERGTDREVAMTLMNLGASYGGADAPRMKELFEQVLPVLEREFGASHPKVAVALTNLVAANVALKCFSAAKEVAARASRIARESCPFPSAVVSEISLSLAVSAQVMGVAEAADEWKKAVAELRAALGEVDAHAKLSAVVRDNTNFWMNVDGADDTIGPAIRDWLHEMLDCDPIRKRRRLVGKQSPERIIATPDAARGTAVGGIRNNQRVTGKQSPQPVIATLDTSTAAAAGNTSTIIDSKRALQSK